MANPQYFNDAFIKAYAQDLIEAASPPSRPAPHFAKPLFDAAKQAAGQSASAPLSSFTTQLEAVEPVGPALEVDQFFWPPECEALISHLPHEMEGVCQRLADGAVGTRKVVAIAGLVRGDGCSTMLLCLARQMARRQERIAIVDGDFRGPALAQRLGLAVESGWQHVLLGELPLRDALVASIDDRLTLLPLAENVSDAEPLAESVQASTSLGMMRTDYDLVLIDVGPILDADSTALKLLRRAGASGAILVRDVRRRNESELLNAARRLASVGVPVLGIAENFAA